MNTGVQTSIQVPGLHSVQFSSVAQSCPTLCDPMNRSTPGLPVHHQLLEFTQTHVHRAGDGPTHPPSMGFSRQEYWSGVPLPSPKMVYPCPHRMKKLSYQFSPSVMSYSLRPHESQHARPPCPSPTPGVHPDSRPSSQ